MELMKSTGGGAALVQPKLSSGSGSVSRQPATNDVAAASEHAMSGSSSDEEGGAPLCAPLLATAGTLGTDGASSALPDPLALMPTADLLSFAF